MNAPDFNNFSAPSGAADQRAAAVFTAAGNAAAGQSLERPGRYDSAEIDYLRTLLETPPARHNAPMLIGSLGSAALLALAAVAAVRDLNEWLIYGIAAGGIGALVLGMRAATANARLREQEALARLLDLPVWTLARATVSNALHESTRIRIVNFLNANYPGWKIDLDQADPAWRDLKHARGNPSTGCGSGCGSRCG